MTEIPPPQGKLISPRSKLTPKIENDPEKIVQEVQEY